MIKRHFVRAEFRILIWLLSAIFSFSPAAFAASQSDLSTAKQLMQSPGGQKALKQFQDKSDDANYDQEEDAAVAPAAADPAKKEISVVEKAFNKEGVAQFGYDIFKTPQSFISQAKDTPVGQDYILGAGDSFSITLWGATEGAYNVEVNRDGKIVLPRVGMVSVAGLTYGDLKPVIERELARYYEKINVGISFMNLRTIRVFMVGEVAKPGSYSISSLSTVFNALFTAGGPTQKGTLRKIELIRNGKRIATVDFYRFLLYGDKSQDKALQSGDTIFIPIIGPTVGITGNVYRPGIYEIKGTADLADLVGIAGGILPTTYLNRVQIERVINYQKKVIEDKKITFSPEAKSYGIPIKNMDFVNILGIYSGVGNAVMLEGSAAKYPGRYELKPNASLKDLLPSPGDLTYFAYLPKAEIIRIDKTTLATKIYAVDLQKFFAGDEAQNIRLESGDRIIIASELGVTASIKIEGEMRLPGTYAIQKGERLSSVIERAGGYTSNAYLFGAVLTRTSAKIVQDKAAQKMLRDLEKTVSRKESEVGGFTGQVMTAKKADVDAMRVALDKIKKGAPGAEGRILISLDMPEKMKGTLEDIILEDGDALFIPSVPTIVNVIGEVYNPCSVTYDNKSRVKDCIKKLGGFTQNADKNNFYLLRADGSVLSQEQGYDVMNLKLAPGDSIIVPEILFRFDMLGAIRDFTQWTYQLVAAYAVIYTVLK